MHVRTVFDHPYRDGQSHWPWRLPRHPAFRHPGEWPILVISERSVMQLRVARHHALHALDVIRIDGQLEPPNLLVRIDVFLQLWPARKAIRARDLKLGIRERFSLTTLQQILRLILQMAEIGTFRKRTRCVLGMGGHSGLLSLNRPSSAHRAERRFAKLFLKQVGFYPFRGPDAPLAHPHLITKLTGTLSTPRSSIWASLPSPNARNP